MKLNKVYNKDCIEYMKTLPNECVNLIIADAPYFSTNIKEVGDKQWKREDEYVDWVIDNFKNYERILKENGSMYFFHNDINIMTEVLYRVKKETKFKLKNQITWDKLATGNQDFLMPLYKNSKLKRRYATSLTEYIYYFTFNDDTGLNQILNNPENFLELRRYFYNEKQRLGLTYKDINSALGTAATGGGMASHYFNLNFKQWTLPTEEMYKKLQFAFKDGFKKDYNELNTEYEKLRYQYEGKIKGYESQRYRFDQPYLTTPKNIEESREVIRPYSTVWHYKRDDEIYSKHLTPKPVKMIKHILNTSSTEDDLVYIPFAGSGSDIVACIEMDRKYIATELNNDYIQNIIDERIENTYKQLNKEVN